MAIIKTGTILDDIRMTVIPQNFTLFDQFYFWFVKWLVLGKASVHRNCARADTRAQRSFAAHHVP